MIERAPALAARGTASRRRRAAAAGISKPMTRDERDEDDHRGQADEDQPGRAGEPFGVRGPAGREEQDRPEHDQDAR